MNTTRGTDNGARTRRSRVQVVPPPPAAPDATAVVPPSQDSAASRAALQEIINTTTERVLAEVRKDQSRQYRIPTRLLAWVAAGISAVSLILVLAMGQALKVALAASAANDKALAQNTKGAETIQTLDFNMFGWLGSLSWLFSPWTLVIVGGLAFLWYHRRNTRNAARRPADPQD